MVSHTHMVRSHAPSSLHKLKDGLFFWATPRACLLLTLHRPWGLTTVRECRGTNAGQSHAGKWQVLAKLFHRQPQESEL